MDEPEYVGGQPFPADLWGTAPIRGRFVSVIEDYFFSRAALDEGFASGDLVDHLIAEGLIPDERKREAL